MVSKKMVRNEHNTPLFYRSPIVFSAMVCYE